MARIIALYSSVPQSGKSTIAQHLEAAWGFETLKFAGPLKAMLYALLRQVNDDTDWCWECIEGKLKEKKMAVLGGKSPRDLMVSLGTDWGREMVSSSLWVDLLKVRATAALKDERSVVIDDMRFPNEYAVLDHLGAHFIHVIRLGAIENGDAATEGLLDTMPWTVTWAAGDGHPEQLRDEVDDHLWPLQKTLVESMG